VLTSPDYHQYIAQQPTIDDYWFHTTHKKKRIILKQN
jgi:hypothetical protein